ncbi:MAG: ADP/ATP-dependent (S)-NAD(P)H-hydrate dehydratase, partial [Woeseiaceae bacterium]|nr:ADP/ATP-dependent (S)-NAD(P)H-hydrate dehydratase [Woeseiaceae bacterium]
LAAVRDFDRELRGPAVLTPHPGEFRRLAAALALDDDTASPGGRRDAAAELARRLGCVVVLKGAGTVVTDGQRTFVNETGNAALATAGTGDVLTGLIAGLLAQGLDPERAAALGVEAHALAGDRAAAHGERGLIASDLLAELRGVLNP